MKAAYINKPGPYNEIIVGDIPTPQPTHDEYLIRIKASALNPIDLYIRAGTIAMPLPKHFISGCDFAGVVEKVGENCSRFKEGDRVWGSNQGLLGRQGTSAEFATIKEDWLYPSPEGVDDQQLAATSLVGITAHLGLFRNVNLKAGETIFVNGGTGGVGSMVVQMAKAIGAKVITTVGSKTKEELCRSWGADKVINYKTDDISKEVKDFTNNQGVNVWFETQREPDFFKIVDQMAPRGRIIIMAGRTAQPLFPVGPFYVKGLTLTGFAMFNATPDEQRRCANDINAWLASGKLRSHIGAAFPLSKAAEAHKLLEENTLKGAGTLSGKVILLP
ncbi:MAG: NADPH:quinone reductase [Planctomycetes bacterium]|nr:NADPH:quinone reductase [Planctomycetota bacterium]NBY01550.1 NADPH:quinone reductase [Planctomycetota bacterium]